VSDPWARLRAERARHYGEPVDMTPRPPSASRTEIATVMQIAQANNDGNVHGGSIMRLVDEAAGIAAMRHAHRRVVTAAMDDMSFLAPVYIGDLVTVRAMVNDAHRTSMEVGVRVDVENVASQERRYVASAHLVFVALNLDGSPSAVPPIVAITDDEKRRQEQARVRREQRLLRKQALSEAARGNQNPPGPKPSPG
jgi:acyl-CoA hydrolase